MTKHKRICIYCKNIENGEYMMNFLSKYGLELFKNDLFKQNELSAKARIFIKWIARSLVKLE